MSATEKAIRDLIARHAADQHWLAEIKARFWANARKSNDPAACWPWTRGKNSGGYGVFGVSGIGQLLAHRVSYWLATGQWPGELFTCHSCDVKNCIRPDHLFLGTNCDNLKDASRKGLCGPQQHPERYAAGFARRRERTHCKNGHEYTPDNTRIYQAKGSRPRRYRVCRTCEALSHPGRGVRRQASLLQG
jgi:hypothetical protein